MAADKLSASRAKRHLPVSLDPVAALARVGRAPPSVIPPRDHSGVPKAASLPGARQAELPDALEPQLATLVEQPPAGGDWLYEIKLDGYRGLARVQRGQVRLFTRNGNDWSDKLQPQCAVIARLPLKSGWLDGEIVVRDDQGRPSFQLLQNAFEFSGAERIEYVLFDLPFADGHDLRAVPLRGRRALLQQWQQAVNDARLSFSAEIEGPPAQLL